MARRQIVADLILLGEALVGASGKRPKIGTAMRVKMALATGLAVMGLGISGVRANMIAVFSGNVGNTYNYTLRFTVDQPGEKLLAGDKITVYDLAPGENLASAAAPVGTFGVSFDNPSGTPAGIGPPLIVDDGSLTNVTFTYLGSTLTTSTDFAATVVTSGSYTSTRFGKAAGTTSFASVGDQTGVNVTTVPAVGGGIPEPATLGMLALGMAGMWGRRRR